MLTQLRTGQVSLAKHLHRINRMTPGSVQPAPPTVNGWRIPSYIAQFYATPDTSYDITPGGGISILQNYSQRRNIFTDAQPHSLKPFLLAFYKPLILTIHTDRQRLFQRIRCPRPYLCISLQLCER